MKSVAVLLCLGLALASHPPSDISEYKPKNTHDQTSYLPGKQFKYYYDSQILNGIPSASSQRSGQRIQAIVELFVQNEQQMVMQLKSVSVGSLNKRLHEKAQSRILSRDVFESTELKPEQKRAIEAPVQIIRKNGLIENVKYQDQEEEWTLNIKRSILSLLSNNLEAKSIQEKPEVYCPIKGECIKAARLPGSRPQFYAVQETTVEGECEVDYTISSNPAQSDLSVVNATKAINLAKCMKRPEVRYNWHLQDAQPQCEYKGKYVNASTVVTINAIGDRNNYVVEQAIAVSEYSVPDMSDDPRATFVAKANQSLKLIEVKAQPAPAVRPSPRMPFGNSLLYSLQWDISKEDFFLNENEQFLSDSPYNDVVEDVVQIAKELLRQLARELSPSIMSQGIQQHAPTTFLRLIKVMRLMKLSELQKLHRDAFEGGLEGSNQQEQQAIKDIIHAAMGAAGTLPTAKHIAQCISSKKISLYQAATAVRQLQNARVVGRKMVDQVKSIADQAEEPALKQVSMLTLGSLYRTWCMPRDSKLASSQTPNPRSANRAQATCQRDVKQQAVDYFMELLNKENKWHEQVLALKSLANTGLPEMLPELQKIIKDQSRPEIVRTEAVIALRMLKESIPHQVVAVALPVVKDQQMEPAVRMAAVDSVMMSQPENPEIQSLAAEINEQSNPRSLKSFIYSYLASIANSTAESVNPCNARIAEQARQALRLVKPEEKILSGSFYSYKSIFNKPSQSNYGFESVFYSAMSNSSFLPALAGWSGGYNWNGFSARQALTFGMSSYGVDKAIAKFLSDPAWSAALSRHPRAADALRQKLSELSTGYESLNPEEAKMTAFMQVFGQDVGFLPLDKNIIKQLIQLYNRLPSSDGSINKHFATLYSESMIKIPTAMGLPLIVRSQTPMIAQIKGNLGRISKTGETYELNGVNIVPSYAMKAEVNSEVWSPVVNSGIKIREESKAVVPLSGSVKVSKNLKELKLNVKMPSPSGREIFAVRAEPLIFTRNWNQAERNTYVQPTMHLVVSEEHHRVQKSQRKWNVLGMEVETRMRNSVPPKEGLWGYPMTPAVFGESSLSIVARKSQSGSCQEMKIKATMSGHLQSTPPLESTVHTLRTEETSDSDSGSEETVRYHSSQYKEHKLFVEAECGGYSAIDARLKQSVDGRMKVAQSKYFNRKGQTQPSKCVHAEVLYPKSPIKQEDTKFKTNSKILIGLDEQSCAQVPRADSLNNGIAILAQSERSQQKIEMDKKVLNKYEQCKREQSLVPCYKHIRQAAMPNKHTLNIKYAGIPQWVKYYVQMATQSFLASHSSRVDIDRYPSTHKANQIRAVVKIDPTTSSRVNITIKEPGMRANLTDINCRLFNWENAMLTRALMPSSWKATCMVSDKKIQTFDKVSFKAPLTDCYSVLAKDCSKDNQFAILMKRETQGSKSKVLAVVTKSQKVEVSKRAEFEVKLNGSPKQLTEQVSPLHDEVFVQKYQGSKVKVTLPQLGIDVYFDGQAAVVVLPSTYFAQQCGLCGHYNRDAQDVFRAPLSAQKDSIIEFFKQYQIQQGSCKVQPDKPEEYRTGSSHSDESAEFHPRTPVSRTLGQYIRGRYCLTTEKWNTCPPGTHPKDYQKQTIQFRCISDDFEARNIAKQIAHGADIRQLPQLMENSHARRVRIPSSCAPDY